MENQLSKRLQTEAGTILFKNFKEDNPAAELLRFIDGLCFKLSLPPLEEGQVLYIAKFLVKEFKWATMDDIDNAILKAKANKLKGVDGADYNKLSIDFLGRVLTAYRQIKGEIRLSKELLTQSDTKVLAHDNNSPIVSYNHIKSVFLDESPQAGGKHQFPDIMLADWFVCYDYLIGCGKMVEQSLENKIEFAEMVREDMLEDMRGKRIDESSLTWKLKTAKQTSKYAVAAECVKRLTMAWFLTNKNEL